MKVSDIISGIDSISSVLDFIEANADSDESGIRDQMINGLKKLKQDLRDYKFNIYLKNAKAKISRK